MSDGGGGGGGEVFQTLFLSGWLATPIPVIHWLEWEVSVQLTVFPNL